MAWLKKKIKRYEKAFTGTQQSPAWHFSTPVKELVTLHSSNSLSIYLNILSNLQILFLF